MKEFQHMLIAQFSAKVQNNYEEYCTNTGAKSNIKTFLIFLIDNGLLNPSDIRKYTIIEEFDELVSTQNIKKSNAINLLSKKFNISDRSIWSMVRRNVK